MRSGIYHAEIPKRTVVVTKGSESINTRTSTSKGKWTRITVRDIEVSTVASAKGLLDEHDNVALAISVPIIGDIDSYIVLVYPMNLLSGLVDLLIGEKPDVGEEEWVRIRTIAIEELGHITGTFFLNCVCSNTGFHFAPSPTRTTTDDAKPILVGTMDDIISSPTIDKDHLFALEMVFAIEKQEISGTLLVLPTGNIANSLMESLE